MKRLFKSWPIVLGLFSSLAWAQADFPNKPLRMIVPFPPGGVTDTSGRLIAEQLSKRLGQQVIVDNKPGASGNIGTQMVASAEPGIVTTPDGYVLNVVGSNETQLPVAPLTTATTATGTLSGEVTSVDLLCDGSPCVK